MSFQVLIISLLVIMTHKFVFYILKWHMIWNLHFTLFIYSFMSIEGFYLAVYITSLEK